MYIKSVDLTNFRNHTEYHLDCNPDTTLILGANGCGKTSVLEAIYILTRGKSFRATDKDILKRGTEFYRVSLEFNTGEQFSATYNQSTKTFLTHDKKSSRLPKKDKYPIVLFLPSDLNLISGSPSRHRDYFDRIFSELSDTYATNLHKYEKALRQRNELLKSDYCKESDLFPWNLLLAKYGSSITNQRRNIINTINNELTSTYYSIAENSDQISLNYITELSDITESHYLKLLEQNFTKDKYIGHTSFGIHRDDFKFIFNNSEADGSASRGETRSIILALKFIEANLLQSETGKKPIILLDDVFSELDNTRRKYLVNNFKNHQVIITSVEDVNY
ncbi:DNA replication and repair protein RecF [Candidatus Saccharibacteria bacterium]|nr:DNA replication and repair protein RecF [Candidatus Saccharibacteria bacterium]